ncbi:MAG: ATP-binding protein involved in chromosome partitioning [Flavobacteriales bacterium]|jgi:ATP-binding protein involved in chromosome partitioning
MTDSARSIVDAALSALVIPGTDVPLMALLADEVQFNSELNSLDIVLGLPLARMKSSLAGEITQFCLAKGLELGEVNITTAIPESQAKNHDGRIPGVKNIIAVASGKGGVGKSTTSVNLALALNVEGATVGLLDADIYGPSQPHMLGVAGRRPEIANGNTLIPIESHGVHVISMGNLVTEETPMIWRGPMVSGALQQLLGQTRWPDVDYLIIDMPPGTGDVALTLSQKVPVSGSVIVTTPQDIALLDAKKGIEMFRKVNIPVYGVVENMAVHICSNCGHEEHIFGEKGGAKLAETYGVKVLGQLPLSMEIREQVDLGLPSVAADVESPIAHIYRNIARKVAAEVFLGAGNNLVPEIVLER